METDPSSLSADSRKVFVSYWQKCEHNVLINRQEDKVCSGKVRVGLLTSLTVLSGSQNSKSNKNNQDKPGHFSYLFIKTWEYH